MALHINVNHNLLTYIDWGNIHLLGVKIHLKSGILADDHFE